MNASNDEEVRRRDRHDIIAEILKTAKEGKIKTHIMYKAKLSYAQINEYIPTLVANGFLENITLKRKGSYKKMFKTTMKGVRFIENFDSMRKMWSDPPNSS